MYNNDSTQLERLAHTDCFLLDMDGTFYLTDQIIDGSLDFIDAVRKAGKRFLFLTNNSSHNADFYVERLRKMGCDVQKEDIMTSGQAAAGMLNRLHPNKPTYVLGNDYLKKELQEFGVNVVEEGFEVLLGGFDTTLTYEKLTVFCDGVRDGLPYYATHPDFNCPVPGGFIPDLGAFMALIEASTGRKADAIAGKPELEIIRAAEERTGIAKERMAMCGDRLYTDIAAGARHGLLSILVLTGESRVEDIATAEFAPNLTFGRLADMIEFL